MTLKKLTAGAVATLTTLAITACASDTEADESTTTATPASDAIEAAGGEDKILSSAEHAARFCHSETTINDEPIGDSDFVPNEFQGAYVEDGGQHIRHVIAGTVDIRVGEAVSGVGYSCSYLQRQTRDAPASDDDLGILLEDEAVSTITPGGQLYIDLREHLRNFHGVSGNDVRVYDEDFSTAQAGWDAHVPDSSESDVEGESVPASSFGDGTHIVGTDIEPGTYRSSGERCYWERLSGFSGTSEDRITNGSNRGGSTIVTIDPTDTAFESSRCGTWELVE